MESKTLDRDKEKDKLLLKEMEKIRATVSRIAADMSRGLDQVMKTSFQSK